MTYIEPITEESASSSAAAMLEADRARMGFVPNFARAFAHRPAVYEAWQRLNGALKQTMDPRRYELVTLAAARRLRSSYCALAHGKVLADQLLEPDTVREVAVDHRSAGMEPVDVAVMDLAEQVVEDASAVTEADVARLRDLGLSDEEIFDVVAAAAARCFFSKTLDALGVRADPVFAEMDPGLREALTVGRPIAEH
ncbi:MAG TPA: peroxidase-related enzyme [Solirubrobacteraceae bacterium]